MKISLGALVSFSLIRPIKGCEVIKNVSHTFYGYPDNDPPGPDILYDCGRGNTAGGVGTYDDPLTFASGSGEFEECEIIYVPYLQKYLRHEDYCEGCDKNWDDGKYHIDIWTGSASVDGKQEQIECENTLTPPPNSIIKDPAEDYPVDGEFVFLPFLGLPLKAELVGCHESGRTDSVTDSELYTASGTGSCNVEHVFKTFDEETYC